MASIRNDKVNAIEQSAALLQEYHADFTEYGKHERREIVAYAATLNKLELVYFCQQVVSYFEDIHKASICLTIFTNELSDVMAD